MKSGASDPFGDSEDERSESSESRTESEANREREDDEDERSESSEKSSGERSDPRDSEESEDERSESSDSRAATLEDDAETDPAIEGGTEPEEGSDAAEDDGPLDRDELPLVLRRDRVKDERPEVHQLFVQQETHDRAVDAERTLEDRLGVDLSRTDAREAIYLAGMAHLDDAEEILRTWGYDL
ncbi:hypothetical protein BV210_19235 (plasmid) [Halorientalis sp. IM1011]|uniref:hypothetical protein n=1 Tax=Halorientalis sp. IM1011 TaxID=1932360 RepID=UPI00097CC65C|nr:hypothetical protein [Halorientalis sp. IM1011]AQL44893.1 hypothetical protein BV210_19235 [Halorientalis sp. IM1011]